MQYGVLKSLTHILNEAYDWTKHGMYYHIQVTPNEKIGFRGIYDKYLSTHVRVEKKYDRKGLWRVGVYTVFAKNGNPIFIAHRSWFKNMTEEQMHPDDNRSTTASLATSASAASATYINKEYEAYYCPEPAERKKVENLSDLSWDDLFNVDI